ncbi:MAG: hypothetical protein FRX49_00456 [Trebouxia sp. A1-2]|nr:MAG: hypothetical protein FRX49_00456 [Trebouxia sp. A1-2]
MMGQAGHARLSEGNKERKKDTKRQQKKARKTARKEAREEEMGIPLAQLSSYSREGPNITTQKSLLYLSPEFGTGTLGTQHTEHPWHPSSRLLGMLHVVSAKKGLVYTYGKYAQAVQSICYARILQAMQKSFNGLIRGVQLVESGSATAPLVEAF